MDLLSLHFDGPLLRGALLRKRRDRFEILSLKTAPRRFPEPVLSLRNRRRASLVTGLSNRHVLVRSLPTDLGKNRHWETALRFQAETQSPFSSEDVLHVPLLVKRETGGAALLYTASKEALSSLLKEMGQMGVDPDRVTSHATGLVRYALWKFPLLSEAYLIDLGSEETTAVWMEKGEVKKSFCLDRGIEPLLFAFWSDQKRILLEADAEEAAKRLNVLRYASHNFPQFTESLFSFRKELLKILLSFSEKGPVLFTGRTDAFHQLCPFLLEGLKEATLLPVAQGGSEEERKYALAIGMGLDTSLQLRQGSFFPPKIWRLRGIAAAASIAASLLLTLGLFGWGKAALREREALLEKKIGKEAALWELSGENLFSQWKEAVDSFSEEPPYLLPAPKVSEILAHLTQDPLFQQLALEGDPLEIQSLRVRLLELPRPPSWEKTYKTEVDLSFSVQNPMNARRIHEFLLKNGDWISQEEEIVWEAGEHGYRALFYVKNRSSHGV